MKKFVFFIKNEDIFVDLELLEYFSKENVIIEKEMGLKVLLRLKGSD